MNPAQFAQLAAINEYARAKQSLRNLDVVRSERVISDVGEWMFMNLFGGERALGRTQKGWDVKIGDRRIQVKAHAKSKDNNARWTEVKTRGVDAFDELVVIVFTQDLRLREIWHATAPAVNTAIVKWDTLKRMPLDDVPCREFLAGLRAAGLTSED